MSEQEEIENLLSKAACEGDMLYTLQNWNWPNLPEHLQKAIRNLLDAFGEFEHELDIACHNNGLDRNDFEGY